MEDVHKGVRAMGIIYGAKGAFVPGLAGGCVPGQCHTQTAERTSNKHSRETEKTILETLDEQEMHTDLKSLLDNSERDVTGMFALQDLLNSEDITEYNLT